MNQEPQFLLTDNGSLRPDATLSLRRLANALSEFTGHAFVPVSLLHSNRIDPAELDGIPAETFEPFIRSRLSSGDTKFVVVPLFFGPSAAAYEFLPQRVALVKEDLKWHDLEVKVAPCLVDTSDQDDTRVAEILADYVRKEIAASSLDRPAVALCDHGAPRIGVTEVRNFLARQMADLLAGSVATVQPCSMERRPGSDYEFNEPLLEKLLHTPEFAKQVVVSMLFFQPGRHAGAGGDVESICADARNAIPTQSTHITDLVGNHPSLIPVLADRLEQVMSSPPTSAVG